MPVPDDQIGGRAADPLGATTSELSEELIFLIASAVTDDQRKRATELLYSANNLDRRGRIGAGRKASLRVNCRPGGAAGAGGADASTLGAGFRRSAGQLYAAGALAALRHGSGARSLAISLTIRWPNVPCRFVSPSQSGCPVSVVIPFQSVRPSTMWPMSVQIDIFSAVDLAISWICVKFPKSPMPSAAPAPASAWRC